MNVGDLDGDGIPEFADSGRFLMRWDKGEQRIDKIRLPTFRGVDSKIREVHYVTFGRIQTQ